MNTDYLGAVICSVEMSASRAHLQMSSRLGNKREVNVSRRAVHLHTKAEAEEEETASWPHTRFFLPGVRRRCLEMKQPTQVPKRESPC